MSNTTSFLNFCGTQLLLSLARSTASRSISIHVEIGAQPSKLYLLGMLRALKWGAVVKPIWLFTTMCIVPPFLWPLRPDKPKPSAIMPWPANAASP